VAVGAALVCVLTREGRVACTDVSTVGRRAFHEVDVGGFAVRVVAGARHACALTREGGVACWGLTRDGERSGDASAVDGGQAPSRIALPERATDIDASEARTCAVTEEGHIYCWGDIGACGVRCSSRSLFAVPEPAKVPISQAVEVRLGLDHTCARKRDGSVECWGDNRRHQVSAFIPFDDVGYSIDRCDTTQRLDLPGTDFPVPVRW